MGGALGYLGSLIASSRESQMSHVTAHMSPVGPLLAAVCAAIGLIAAALVLDAPRTAFAEHPADCTVTNLGQLPAGADAVLTAEGRWTTEDCDSRFASGRDAHTYRFSLTAAGRIRIELGVERGGCVPPSHGQGRRPHRAER